MKHFSLIVNYKFLFNNLVFFVFFLVSNTAAIAQNIDNVVAINTIAGSPAVKKESVSTVYASDSMNFVLWFMGSKQDPNTAVFTEGTTIKKQVITSGKAPNRLLLKAFLKKALNSESTIA